MKNIFLKNYSEDDMKILAEYGGITGIALGVLLFIFRDFIKHSFFSKLSQKKSSQIVILLICGVFGVAIFSMVVNKEAVKPGNEVTIGRIDQETTGDNSPAVSGVGGNNTITIDSTGGKK